jgi:hypothetical protein
MHGTANDVGLLVALIIIIIIIIIIITRHAQLKPWCPWWH